MIFVETNAVKKVLKSVNKLTAIGEHEKAYNELVSKINVDDILQSSLKKKYYYSLGITTLVGLNEVDKAEQIFAKILEDFDLSGEVEDILILVGLGIISFERKNIEDARSWFKKALLLLRNETLFVEENIREILKIYYNMAKFYSSIYEYTTALSIAEEGLRWADELDSSYHLGYLLYEKGFVLYKTEQYKLSYEFYNSALNVAFIKNHTKLVDTIFKDAEEFDIILVYTNIGELKN